MKTHLILTEDWPEMKNAITEAVEYLKIFDVKITYERKDVDVTSEFLYETNDSWAQLLIKKTKSLKAGYIFGLSPMDKAQSCDCLGIICDKSKTIEDAGLYGQQQTLGNKQIIEVYAVKKRGGSYGFTPTGYILIHELFHALADFYGVEDRLHQYVDKNRISMDSYRSELIGKIYKSEYGLLPLVDQKAKQLIEYAKTIGSPIKITEGYRTPERQTELFKQKPKVTNAKAWESMHQYRVAFDIVFKNEGYNAPKYLWEKIADFAKEIGLEWGGDWKGFVDKPHFELTFGKKLKHFQANEVDWKKYFDIPYPTTAAYVFTRDLSLGSRGEDVRQLQIKLNNEGFKVTEKGQETTYFGKLTQQALIAYQKAHNISPAQGYFGPLTRAQMK